MDKKQLLKKLEASFNSKTCKYCGRKHIVHITQVPSYLKTFCHQADSTIPRGETTITIKFDEDTCIRAQTDITLIVAGETAHW